MSEASVVQLNFGDYSQDVKIEEALQLPLELFALGERMRQVHFSWQLNTKLTIQAWRVGVVDSARLLRRHKFIDELLLYCLLHSPTVSMGCLVPLAYFFCWCSPTLANS